MTIEYKDSKRIVKLSTDTANPLIYSDDFTSDNFNYSSANSKFSYDSTNKRMNFDITSNSSTARAYKQLPSTLGGSDWEIRYTLKIDSITSTGNTTGFMVAISSNDSGNSNSYHMEFLHDGSGRNNYFYANAQGNTSEPNFWSVGTEYFVSIKATASTGAATFKAYTSASDRSAETNPVANSTISKTPSTAPTTLMGYLVVKNERPTNSGSMDGYVKDIQIGNFSTKPTDVQDNSILVEKDTAKRFWFSEATTITYEDDLSASTNWGGLSGAFSYDATNDEIDFNADTSGSSAYWDLGSTLSDTNWVMRMKVRLDTMSASSANIQNFNIGLSSTNGAYNATQDSIGMLIRADSAGNKYKSTWGNDEAQNGNPSNFTRTPSAETIYLEITRDSATGFTVRQYSDSAYSTLLESKVVTGVTATGLQYVKLTTYSEATTNNMVGAITDVKLYNGVTSVTPATWTMEPTYESDFSSSTGWVPVGSNVTITSGELKGNAFSSSGDNRIYYDLSSINDTAWIMKFEYTPKSSTAGAYYMPIALTAGNGALNASADAVRLYIDMGSYTSFWRTKDGSTEGSAGTQYNLTAGTKYYYTVTNNNRTLTSIVRTGSHSGTTVSTQTTTIQAGVTGLTHLQSGASSFNAGTNTYSIDNLEFYNGVTTIN